MFAEALLSGVPVVTTDMGGAPEIVSEACGRLVPAGDVDALARVLGELVDDSAPPFASGPSGAGARGGALGAGGGAASNRGRDREAPPDTTSMTTQAKRSTGDAAVERGLKTQGESDAPIYRDRRGRYSAPDMREA